MNNYIVYNEKLLADIFRGKPSRKYHDIINKIYSSNAIIWSVFAPWRYSDPNNSNLILKIIDSSLGIKIHLESDFNKNQYIFFKPKGYFDYTEADLVINNEKNIVILEAKYTEDSDKGNNDKGEQISSYLCDIFYKLMSASPPANIYFIVLYPKEIGRYYEYYQIINDCKNNLNLIKSKIKECIDKRKNKQDSAYDILCYECEQKLSSDECESLLKKMSEAIGLLSWDELKELLFESINETPKIKNCIDNYGEYEKFFNDRTNKDFLLKCYAYEKSNLRAIYATNNQ